MFVGGWRGWGNPRQVFWPRLGNSRFWQNLPRGSNCLSASVPNFDDSRRTGLHRTRRRAVQVAPPSASTAFRHRNGVVWVSLAAGTLTACRSAPAPDPATIFENIRNDSLHGNLDVAQQKAEKARKDFSASDADWPMKFRVLEAEILTYQGRRPEVLALLNDPSVSYPECG